MEAGLMKNHSVSGSWIDEVKEHCLVTPLAQTMYILFIHSFRPFL